jgi:peptidoglycan glycosyltransferase
MAESVNQGTPTDPLYVREYPDGPLYAHPVGYAFANFGSAGLEQFYNDDLIGQGDDLESIFGNLNEEDPGDDLKTTIDSEAQRTAVEALGGRPGAIVALEPDTGAVKVMASVPSYDPNQVPDRFEELSDSEPPALPNRATQSGYPPGSTFKVVTAAAALDTGEFTPDSVVNGDSPKTVGGTPLENFGGQSFGPVSLTEALTNSVNTVWAQVGVQVGAETMFEYMARFGIGERPPLDYPPNQLLASGVYDQGELLDSGDGVDIGRVAIGQERLLVTPLQMAMVAGAVANDGTLMRPHLGDEIVSPEGRITERVRPSEVRQVMEPDSASALTQMMTDVVNEGSGTAAALEGIDVAGKTGTAEVEGGAANQAWFISFAPADAPEMAIAVTIERTQGTGGEEAAPLAKQVLEVLLQDG